MMILVLTIFMIILSLALSFTTNHLINRKIYNNKYFSTKLSSDRDGNITTSTTTITITTTNTNI